MEVDSLDKIECRTDGMLLPAWAAPGDAGAAAAGGGVGSAGYGGGCPSLPLVWLQVRIVPSFNKGFRITVRVQGSGF